MNFCHRYRDRMQEISRIFRDRPLSLQETVVHWTEYVLKYKGAAHLNSAAADMPLYQYLLLDVICFVAIVVAGIICGCYYCIKRLYTWSRITKNLKIEEYCKKNH